MNLGLGLNIATTKSGGGLLTPFDTATPTAGYSLRPLSIESYAQPVVKVRRSSDNTEKDFASFEITNGALESWIHSANESPADYGAGAAAAYSLRYVSDSYTGNVVRVRRSVDNAEQDFTPSEITDGTLLAWVGTTASDHGHVTTWYDQSGNSNDATQGTAASQPKIVDAGVLVEENGKPAVEFDGVDDYLSITTINQPSEFSHFLTSKGTGFCYGTALGGTDYIRYTGYIRISINNITITENTNVDNLQTQTSFIRSNTDLTTIYYNSNTGVSSTNSGEFNSDSIGSYNNGTILYDGYIQEHIIYDSDQSANRKTIEANINKYYDIYTPTVDGFVSKWYDQFGSNDATQTSASNQPKIWDALTGLLTEGGRPAIEFDGVDDELSYSITNTNAVSVFIIQKNISVLSGSRYYVAYRQGANTWGVLSNSPSNQSFLIYQSDTTSVIASGTSSGITNQNLLSAIANGVDTITLNENGTLLDSDTYDGTLNTTSSGGNIGTNSSSYSNSLIQEIIIYNTDQSANREAIEDNINVYYVLYGLKHYRQRVLADSGTFALQGRDALVYNSVTIPEMPSLICSCDAYKATKLYNINPA